MNKTDFSQNLDLPWWIWKCSDHKIFPTDNIKERFNKILSIINEIQTNYNTSGIFWESEKVVELLEQQSNKKEKTSSQIKLFKDKIKNILSKDWIEKKSIYKLFELEFYYNEIAAEEIIDRLALLEQYIFWNELKDISAISKKAIKIWDEIQIYTETLNTNIKENINLDGFELLKLYKNQKALYKKLHNFYKSIVNQLTNLDSKEQYKKLWLTIENKLNNTKTDLSKEIKSWSNVDVLEEKNYGGLQNESLIYLWFINKQYPDIDKLSKLKYKERWDIKINWKGLCYIAGLLWLRLQDGKTLNPVARNYDYAVFVEAYKKAISDIDLKKLDLKNYDFKNNAIKEKKQVNKKVKSITTYSNKILNEIQFETVIILLKIAKNNSIYHWKFEKIYSWLLILFPELSEKEKLNWKQLQSIINLYFHNVKKGKYKKHEISNILYNNIKKALEEKWAINKLMYKNSPLNVEQFKTVLALFKITKDNFIYRWKFEKIYSWLLILFPELSEKEKLNWKQLEIIINIYLHNVKKGKNIEYEIDDNLIWEIKQKLNLNNIIKGQDKWQNNEEATTNWPKIEIPDDYSKLSNDKLNEHVDSSNTDKKLSELFLLFQTQIQSFIQTEIQTIKEDFKKILKEKEEEINRLNEQKQPTEIVTAKIEIWNETWKNEIYYINMFLNTVLNLAKKTKKSEEYLEKIKGLEKEIDLKDINFSVFLTKISDIMQDMIPQKPWYKKNPNIVDIKMNSELLTEIKSTFNNVDEKTIRGQLFLSRIFAGICRWDLSSNESIVNKILPLLSKKDQLFIKNLRKNPISKIKIRKTKTPKTLDDDDENLDFWYNWLETIWLDEVLDDSHFSKIWKELY